MKNLLTIAKKEFIDNLLNRRFIAIIIILLLGLSYGLVIGVNSYNQSVNGYKDLDSFEQSWRRDAISSLENYIHTEETNGASAVDIQALKAQLNLLMNPVMPAMTDIYKSTIFVFILIGPILGISLGFNIITKEKEEYTLSTLLSSPINRDKIINGKMLGVLLTLGIAIAGIFMFGIAILLLLGIVPDFSDIIRIALYHLAVLAYCTVFFAIAMMSSMISKNSLLVSIGIIFALVIITILLPVVLNPAIDLLIGPAPVLVYYQGDDRNLAAANNITMPVVTQEYAQYLERQERYNNERYKIIDIVTTVSPIDNFGGNLLLNNAGIASILLSKENYVMHNYIIDILPYGEIISLGDSIVAGWYKILALIVEIIIAFAVSYVKFLKMDVK